MGDTRLTARILIPQGWKVDKVIPRQPAQDAQWASDFAIKPVDNCPEILRYFWPAAPIQDSVQVYLEKAQPGHVWRLSDGLKMEQTYEIDPDGPNASRRVFLRQSEFMVSVNYHRSDSAAFKRTYRQICNSLRIE